MFTSFDSYFTSLPYFDVLPEGFSNTLYTFARYSNNLKLQDANGKSLASAYLNQGLSSMLDSLGIYIKSHRKFIQAVLDFNFNQLQNFTPQTCPRKYYCLDGVATFTENLKWDYTPKLCKEGYYCLEGAKYLSGTDTCPSGKYCSAGTDVPSLTQSSNTGSNSTSIQTGCYISSFSTGQNSSDCLKCADGYECTEKGMAWPRICREGYFRTIYSQCTPCPAGTYSFEKGAKDSSSCVPCPEGTQCTSTNINSIDQIKACETGKVCSEGTGLIAAKLCPNGYYCTANTTQETQYDNKCPIGYYCVSGTDEGNKLLFKCPKNYYCPLGSKDYVIIFFKIDEYY